jgi:hypothetical protein
VLSAAAVFTLALEHLFGLDYRDVRTASVAAMLSVVPWAAAAAWAVVTVSP